MDKTGRDVIGQDDSPLIDTRRPIPRAVPPPGVMTGKRRAGQSLENPNSNLNFNLDLALDPNAGRKDAEACVVAGEQREGQDEEGEGEGEEEESESIGISINKGNTRNFTC